MASSAEIRQQLVTALRRDLIGPERHERERSEERLAQPPSVWYTTGFLVPHLFQQEADRPAQPDAASFADLAGEEPSLEAAHRLEKSESDDDASDSLDQASVRRSWFPSSLGLSFILEQGSELEVTASWGDYSAPGKDDADKLWKRKPSNQDPKTITISGPGSSDDIPLENTSPGMCLRWIARPAPSQLGYPANQLSVSLFLLNRRQPPVSDQIRHRDPVTAFQSELVVTCRQGFPPRRDALQNAGNQDSDEALAALQYRHDHCFASGHNVAVLPSGIDPARPDRATTLTTTWLPTAEVMRVLPEPPEHLKDTLPLGMEQLAQLAEGEAGVDGETGSAERLIPALQPMVEAYRDWIKDQHRETLTEVSLQATAAGLKQAAEDCAARIEAGIALLADPLVREAFRTMNVVMARAQRQRQAFGTQIPPDQIGSAANTRAPGWRFFQLAFVLLNLPGLANPHSREGRRDRETVELLFFPTGGGKTEAYLGLAAFTLVHRRLSHPGIESAGITVLMRYTLRLLTLDQLGRAATLICALELERRERAAHGHAHPLGEWPFEIGMWVGKAATPNRLGGPGDSDKTCTHAQLHRWKHSGGPSPIPVETCPWCNRPLHHSGFMLVPRNQPKRLDIYCREPQETGRQNEGSRREEFAHMGPCPFRQGIPLPLLAVDEQIYRRLPCFLIATIDKFAALPWVGKSAALFGNVSHWQKPHANNEAGFWGPAEAVAGVRIPAGRLLPPQLVIQDELHLISGPLGTLAGLYEAVIERLMQPDAEAPPPKIIASTATVRRADTQIRALFGRSRARVFPPPGPDRSDNFFSRTVLDSDQARLYVGLSAPGRNLKGVLLRAYLGLMAAAQKAWDQHRSLREQNPADPYMTLLGYFSNLKELGVTRSILEDELGAQLVDFARNRSLPMERADNLFASRTRLEMPEELTSRVSTAQVSVTKNRLSKPYADRQSLDVALATNMISVGLDIARLGLMVVLNQPKTAAEYIQATSRVGRQLSDKPEQNKPGLVLVLLNPNRPRDRSHFELFPYWHQTFYRQVEATSCTPFASRALDRGLPGVVVALARHSNRELTPPTGALKEQLLLQIQDQIARELQDRADVCSGGSVGSSPSQPGTVQNAVLSLMQSWWTLTQEPEARFQYWTHEDRTAGIGLLHTPLDTDQQYKAPGFRDFTTNWSLRDVEPSVPIRLVNFKEDFTDEPES